MITLKNNHIRWEQADVRQMANILGSEFAVVAEKKRYRQAPAVMSILKLAQQQGLHLSAKARRAVRRAKRDHKRIKRLKAREDFPALPDPLAKKYFKHQRADLSFLYEEQPPGVLIAHEAGVGKTLLVIRYAEFLQAKRIMLIVPNAAKEQWASEIRRWSTRKMPITIIEGSSDHQIQQIKQAKRGWVIGHWESLVHARKGWGSRTWDMTAVDEIQYMQNRNAQRTLTLHKIRADKRMALGAHPYANGVSELFSVLKFLYPERYPSFWRWANMHIQIDEAPFGGLDLRDPKREKLLKWEIDNFTLRRLWKDTWKNLPPITRVQRTAYLTPKMRREYDRLRKQFFVELESHRDVRNILAIPSMLARITRLRQYLVDPGILDAKASSIKYPIVHDLIKELEGFPPVIFTMWRETAFRLQAYLKKKKLKVEVIVGGMSSKQINRIKKRFVAGKYDAVIIMIKVGGTSLNFGGFGKIIYLDHPWNQRDVEQTEGRVRRPKEGTGVVVPATSYHIIVKDSYEERMRTKRYDKHADFEKVFTVAQAREIFEEAA